MSQVLLVLLLFSFVLLPSPLFQRFDSPYCCCSFNSLFEFLRFLM